MKLTDGPKCSGRIDSSFIVATREIDFSVSGNKQQSGFTLVLGAIGYRPPPPAASYAGITTLVSTGLTATGPPLTIPNSGPQGRRHGAHQLHAQFRHLYGEQRVRA